MSDPFEDPSAYEAYTPNPQETVAKLLDLADMPRYNPITNTTGRSDRDVSEGKVYLHPTWKVACLEHGAMNCVNEQRTIWRCLTCGRGAYAPEPLVAELHVVQVPQESSPGFEDQLDFVFGELNRLSGSPVNSTLRSNILAAHNRAIQEAKREEREACVKVARYWLENDGRPKHLIQDLEEPDKTTLEHLEEETT